MTDDERIAQIRELAEKPTQGTFIATEFTPADGKPFDSVEQVAATTRLSALHGGTRLFGITIAEDTEVPARVVCYTGNGPSSEANAQFLAESATSVRELLTLLDEQKKRIEELEAAHEPHDVEDGFGSVWPPCEKHQCTLQVMRPGDARCPECDTESVIADAEARASRAEQLYAKAIEMRDAESSRADAAHDAYREMLQIRASQDVQIAELTMALAATPPLQTQMWIPVGEKLPDVMASVLLAIPVEWEQKGPGREGVHFIFEVGWLESGEDGEMWFGTESDVYEFENVTHWQPLPSPPEEEKA